MGTSPLLSTRWIDQIVDAYVDLVTLIDLVAKTEILIVEVAELQVHQACVASTISRAI